MKDSVAQNCCWKSAHQQWCETIHLLACSFDLCSPNFFSPANSVINS